MNHLLTLGGAIASWPPAPDPTSNPTIRVNMRSAKHSRDNGVVDSVDHTARFLQLASALCDVGKTCYARGWALGTGGNFSAVLSTNPLRLAITPSGADKGSLVPSQILEVDQRGRAAGNQRASFEARLHLAIAGAAGAGAVVHTHSVPATLLSERLAGQRGLTIEGYEMLKGLEGITTHEHREWVPILENSQDMAALADRVEQLVRIHPAIHGFLLRGHGLYTWGKTIADARRHLEVFEFLFEVEERASSSNAGPGGSQGGRNGSGHDSR